MSLATTTNSAAIGVNDTTITVASATGFASGNVVIVEKERMRVAQGYNGTALTVPVLRGRDGTAASAHPVTTTIEVGVPATDWPLPMPTATVDGKQVYGSMNEQNITATGATGSTAAAVTSNYPAIVLVSGVSGAGINLPTGAAIPGAYYLVSHASTGVINVYSVGATINGTTGTTAFAITATGNKTATIFCAAPNAWLAVYST